MKEKNDEMRKVHQQNVDLGASAKTNKNAKEEEEENAKKKEKNKKNFYPNYNIKR